MKALMRKIGLVVKEPKLLLGKMRGIEPVFYSYCLHIERILGKNVKTIIDVGANKGRFINACKNFFPNSIIYAFEPSEEMCKYLKKIKGIEVFNFGLWNKDCKKKFYEDTKEYEMSSFLKGLKSDTKNIRIVSLKRFDGLRLKIERPSFVKIDTEGGDYKVLEGFGKMLKRIDVIQLELFFSNKYEGQSKLSEIVSLLKKYNFNRFIQTSLHYDTGKLIHCDLIFFR